MTITPFPDRMETVQDFALTDSGNADFFEREIDHTVLYDHDARRWYRFGDQHWHVDVTNQVQELAVAAMRSRQHEAMQIADRDLRKAAMAYALKSEDRRRIADMLALASSRPTIAVDGSAWDTAPMLFGVQNGTVDLERGVLRPGCRSDRITKVSPVLFDASATAPRFEQFMVEIFCSSPELVDYLQRVLGYCLTGDVSEQQFWIWWGTGSNGKSTLLALLLKEVFGDADGSHAWAMPFPTAHWSTAVSEYQRAELPGRRLVAASEVKRKAPLHEDFIKSLTGGDRVNARQPYGRPFNFVPSCKFVLLCNEQPIIRDQTQSMWRRLRLVPFVETFPIDTTLGAVLKREAPGVLNWLLRGCTDWIRDGLGTAPAVVETATQDYRSASDPLLEFYEERCIILDGVSVGAAELFTVYRSWCDSRHLAAEDRLSQKAFGLRVRERFHDISPTERKVIYGGIGLLTDEAERGGY